MNITHIKGGRHRKYGIANHAALLLLGLLPGTVSPSGLAAGGLACTGALDPMPANHRSRCNAAVSEGAGGYYLAALSGGRQTGTAGGLLAEPIVARLVDEAGNGIAGGRILFSVRRGCGHLVDAQGIESRHLVLRTDARGDAAVAYRLGSCSDPRAELVCAYAASAPKPVHFILSTAVFSAAASTADTRLTRLERKTEEE